MNHDDPTRRRFLSQLAFGALLSSSTTWSATGAATPATGEATNTWPLAERFPGIASGAGPNNGLSPQRIPYPPCDEKLKAEIDAVLARTEQIWNRQEWWRLRRRSGIGKAALHLCRRGAIDVMVGWDSGQVHLPAEEGPGSVPLGLLEPVREGAGPGVALALYDHWFESSSDYRDRSASPARASTVCCRSTTSET